MLLNNPVNDYGCETKKVVKSGYKTTNSPPVAVDDQIRLEMNSVLIIRQKTLFKNDSDPDGDALRTLLIKSGLGGKKIKAYGMCEKNPVADNSTSDAGDDLLGWIFSQVVLMMTPFSVEQGTIL